MRKFFVSMVSIIVTMCLLVGCSSNIQSGSIAEKSDEEVIQLIKDAYVYSYPLIMMEMTKRVITNVPQPLPNGFAPINQIGHKNIFPDPDFKEVVKPNVDTLYSSGFLSVKNEPVVLTLPDMGDRYYLFPMLDAWSNVIASPGTRETGNKAGNFLITSSEWEGTVPEGMTRISSPTDTIWIIGRTKVNGKEDIPNVVKVQQEYKVTPLSAWGKPYTARKNQPDPNIKMLPPKKQVTEMSVDEFLNLANQLMIDNPPYDYDKEIIEKIAEVNVGPGKIFDSLKYSDKVKQAIAEMPQKVADELIFADHSKSERSDDGWSYSMLRGRFGTDYFYRAYIALAAFGSNTPEDAIYPDVTKDGDGNRLNGNNKYVIHFTKEQLPPANAFWSLTMYGKDDYLVANPINKYAIKDDDDLKFNNDGSLDIYVQKDSPGQDKESNWLPAPADDFSMHLRVYWPAQNALDGKWDIPPVKKVN